jgi:hypothetical protein
MDVNSTPAPADSSTAVIERPSPSESSASPGAESFEVPKDPAARLEWRKTGKLPEKNNTPKKEASAPSTNSETNAPASEAGSDLQERKQRSNAETRLTELLGDLKRAGLSPAELKTFKREVAAAAAEQTPNDATPKPEHTAKPADAPKAPEYGKPKPKLDDFDSIEEYTEAFSEWNADKRDFDKSVRDQQETQQKELSTKLEAARERYGAETDAHLQAAARSIFNDAAIPSAVKAIVNDSPVLVDLLYTLGSKSGELEAFIALAKAKPGEAIRKAVLMERLIADELGKPGASAETESDAAAAAANRDESGKFVSEKPAKRVTQTPAPPREASGRAAAPPDALDAAAKNGDFRSYREHANRRDLNRFKGN